VEQNVLYAELTNRSDRLLVPSGDWESIRTQALLRGRPLNEVWDESAGCLACSEPAASRLADALERDGLTACVGRVGRMGSSAFMSASMPSLAVADGLTVEQRTARLVSFLRGGSFTWRYVSRQYSAPEDDASGSAQEAAANPAAATISANQLADILLHEVMISSQPIQQLLEERGITNGGDINGILDATIFGVFPADSVLEVTSLNGHSEFVRTYLRVGVHTIIHDVARQYGALRSSDEEFENFVKRRFEQMFDYLAGAYHAAPLGEKYFAIGAAAVYIIGSVSGRPANDEFVAETLGRYFRHQMDVYADIIRQYIITEPKA
jgi:hypothetical protein